jgi:hypothetical protein
MPHSDSVEIWQRKLHALRIAEATVFDPGLKFAVGEQIAEAERMIAEQQKSTNERLKVDTSRLPTTDYDLFGRGRRLEEITIRWNG